jgi:TolB-like protein
MSRSLSSVSRIVALAATLALPALAAAQADTRPVVVVYRFDNNSIGTGSAEFNGMATAVQDLLITDLASNTKFRIVDRTHLNDILTEQNLSKSGQVDPATAVRVGKILGAQYAVTGGFMSDGKGSAILTGRTIDIETTQIANPQKIQGKTDNVLGLITDLSTRITTGMNLAPKPGAGSPGRRGDANDAAVKTNPAGSDKPASSAAKPKAVETYAHGVTTEKAMKVKLDAATMKVYSSALDEMDRKNNAAAAKLFKQVADKFPDFEPAADNLRRLSASKASD